MIWDMNLAYNTAAAKKVGLSFHVECTHNFVQPVGNHVQLFRHLINTPQENTYQGWGLCTPPPIFSRGGRGQCSLPRQLGRPPRLVAGEKKSESVGHIHC